MTTSQMECEQVSRMMKLSASEVEIIHMFDVENYIVIGNWKEVNWLQQKRRARHTHTWDVRACLCVESQALC